MVQEVNLGANVATARPVTYEAFVDIVDRITHEGLTALQAWQALGFDAPAETPARLAPAAEAVLSGLPEGDWKFAVPARSPSKAAHIWGDQDTLCKLSKNAGLKRGSYFLADNPGERKICPNCIVVARQRRAD